MMVPAVTEVCLPQSAHSQVHALVCSDQALPVPQAGQTKPVGQRTANRYSTQAASSGNGSGTRSGSAENRTRRDPGELMFALCSIISRCFSPPLMVAPDAWG